ncbi:hypothetical protein J2Z48_001800 [Croceifilum oryzae]|uniref:Uncharacterized protein n=1 Tax=Croceifilum oryzae TaxID=1553429 RepID=A0AAJ1WQJ8_9BACL|nr:hypothetical protein [Croceifilum oryzae]MDQ0417627.1 hypothetical protein [Croceifilum oryzae]
MKLARWLFKLSLLAILTGGIWVLLMYAQQINYHVPNQSYLMSTHLSYTIFFIFALLLPIFLYNIFRNRKRVTALKRSFYLFTAFYLIMAPTVVLAFDNYLLATPHGITYNTFMSINQNEIEEWSSIEKLTLDYSEESSFTGKSGYRLKFIVDSKDRDPIDLNNYNSPLYKKGQFLIIYERIASHGVPIEIARPLPKEGVDPNSLVAEIYQLAQKQKERP